ncbi:hypothetical protein LguiB_007600 [Lonicera macranthoides]
MEAARGSRLFSGKATTVLSSNTTTSASVCGTSGMLYGLVAFCTGLPCIISFAYRTTLRIQYGLVESPAAASVVHLFCDCCALCQEYRELQLRGIDPTIGMFSQYESN